MTLMIIVTSPNAGKYASKHGSRGPMTYGLILAGGGLVALGARATPPPNYWDVAPAFSSSWRRSGRTASSGHGRRRRVRRRKPRTSRRWRSRSEGPARLGRLASPSHLREDAADGDRPEVPRGRGGIGPDHRHDRL